MPAHKKRVIELASQGVGAHGAFTWGVLDRLLEDGRIRIEGVSGTSAGAMNGAVVTDGFVNRNRTQRLYAHRPPPLGVVPDSGSVGYASTAS